MPTYKTYCDDSDKNHPDFYLRASFSPVSLLSLFLLNLSFSSEIKLSLVREKGVFFDNLRLK